MCLTLLGLVFDVVGALLLVRGELMGPAAVLNYWGTGEQKDYYESQFKKYWWGKRWPLQLGVRWGRKGQMGQEAIVDSFPFTAWGIALLIVGFVLQGIGSFYSR